MNTLILDRDGIVLAVSAGTQAVWSIDPDSLPARATLISDYIHDWESATLQADLSRATGAIVSISVPTETTVDDDGAAGDDASVGVAGSGSDDDESPSGSAQRPTAATIMTTENVELRCRLQRVETTKAAFFVIHWARLTALDKLAQSRALNGTAAPVTIMKSALRTPVAASASSKRVTAPRSSAPPVATPKQQPVASLAASLTARTIVVSEGKESDVTSSDAPSPTAPTSPGTDAADADRSHISFDVPPPPDALPPAALLAVTSMRSWASKTPKSRPDAVGGDAAVAPPKTFGGRGSVNSGATSVNSTIRSMNRLRRIVATETPPMLPSLMYLRMAGVLLMVLAIILAVVLSTVTTSNFSQIDSDIEFVILGSEKLIYKATAILCAQSLILDGRYWLNLTEEGRTLNRAYILTNLTEFTNKHLKMAAIAQTSKIAWTWTRR